MGHLMRPARIGRQHQRQVAAVARRLGQVQPLADPVHRRTHPVRVGAMGKARELQIGVAPPRRLRLCSVQLRLEQEQPPATVLAHVRQVRALVAVDPLAQRGVIASAHIRRPGPALSAADIDDIARLTARQQRRLAELGA